MMWSACENGPGPTSIECCRSRIPVTWGTWEVGKLRGGRTRGLGPLGRFSLEGRGCDGYKGRMKKHSRLVAAAALVITLGVGLGVLGALGQFREKPLAGMSLEELEKTIVGSS